MKSNPNGRIRFLNKFSRKSYKTKKKKEILPFHLISPPKFRPRCVLSLSLSLLRSFSLEVPWSFFYLSALLHAPESFYFSFLFAFLTPKNVVVSWNEVDTKKENNFHLVLEFISSFGFLGFLRVKTKPRREFPNRIFLWCYLKMPPHRSKSEKNDGMAKHLRRDPYEVLGVSRNSKDQEIKSAYRKMALKYV